MSSHTKTPIYREGFADASVIVRSGQASWLDARRQEAFVKFRAMGFPTSKHENWRTLDLGPILETSYEKVPETSTPKLDEAVIRGYRLSDDEERMVFVDGVFSPALSSIHDLPANTVLENLMSTFQKSNPSKVREHLASAVATETNSFALVNTFQFSDGVYLYIPDKVVLDKSIHILFVTSANPTPMVYYPRVLIVAGESARVRVVVNHVNKSTGKSLKNSVAEVYLAPNACVDFTEIVRGTKESYSHLARRFYLSKHSALNALSIVRQGAVTREDSHVEFLQPHAFASLKGLAVVSGNSQVFQHVNAQHNVPECTSRQFYKNILLGNARSEFNSLVFVHKDAQKSDSRQLNKNLLLSDKAQSFSRPQLRIDADDVQASHGATVGQLDRNEVFYLRSRGLSEKDARFLLTYGFAEEILEEVSSPSMRQELERFVEDEIRGALK